MAKQTGVWIESRRCLQCNPLLPKDSKIEKKAGFIQDPENEGRWVPCMYCNDKGYTTKRGTLSS